MDTPKNIAYLLGAGASANCLPVINELPSRLKRFIDIIQQAINFAETDSSPLKPEDFNKDNVVQLKEDVKWLIDEMRNHKTVDTLAKKFYLIEERHNDLVKLKKILSSYFIFEQILPTPDIRTLEIDGKEVKQDKELPDKRYDSFIATIINGKPGELSLSPNFKIVSWNYDIQMELAYKQYKPSDNIFGIQHQLQSIPTKSYATSDNHLNADKFSLVRLNGIAGLMSFDAINYHLKKGIINNEKLTHSISAIANSYRQAPTEESEYLNYSWENSEDYQYIYRRKQGVIDEACQIMRKADIIVIIGYSFPIFNRNIDREIFADCPNLKKVYVQDKNANEIKELISSSIGAFNSELRSVIYNNTQWSVEVIPVNSVEQFFIPPEADL